MTHIDSIVIEVVAGENISLRSLHVEADYLFDIVWEYHDFDTTDVLLADQGFWDTDKTYCARGPRLDRTFMTVTECLELFRKFLP